MSRVRNNKTALRSYIESMLCALDKADNGSNCEDSYFVEKLERMAARLNYSLVPKQEPKKETLTDEIEFDGIVTL